MTTGPVQACGPWEGWRDCEWRTLEAVEQVCSDLGFCSITLVPVPGGRAHPGEEWLPPAPGPTLWFPIGPGCGRQGDC